MAEALRPGVRIGYRGAHVYVESDALPEVLALAELHGTRPEFIERPNFLRCPRCERVWPEDHFRPDRARYAPGQVRARCRDCRRGLAAVARTEARATGLCEARNCGEPHVRRLKCEEHARMSDEFHSRHSPERTPASA